MRSRATTLTGTAVRRIDLAPGRIQSQRLASRCPRYHREPSSSRRARRIGPLPGRHVSIAGGTSCHRGRRTDCCQLTTSPKSARAPTGWRLRSRGRRRRRRTLGDHGSHRGRAMSVDRREEPAEEQAQLTPRSGPVRKLIRSIQRRNGTPSTCSKVDLQSNLTELRDAERADRERRVASRCGAR